MNIGIMVYVIFLRPTVVKEWTFESQTVSNVWFKGCSTIVIEANNMKVWSLFGHGELSVLYYDPRFWSIGN